MANITVRNHAAYATKWGHGYEPHRGLISEAFRSPQETATVRQMGYYWQKVAVLQNVLSLPHSPEFDWLLWIDSDAVFTNADRDLAEIVREYGQGKDLIMPLDLGDDAIRINNGVFLLRNSRWSRQFLNRVTGLFPLYGNQGTPEQDAMRDVMYSGSDGHDFAAHRGPGNYRESLLQLEVTVVPQRVMNSFHRRKEGDLFSGAQWMPGDFIAHVSNLPLDIRIEALRQLAG